MNNFRTITLTVFAVCTLSVWLCSCAKSEEIEASQGPSPIEKPGYDSIYNKDISLYVVDNDTIAYSNNDKEKKLTDNEVRIGQSLSEYAVKMRIDYGQANTENSIMSPLCATTLYSMMANFTSTGKADNNNEYKKEININGSTTEELNSYHRKIKDLVKSSKVDEKSETECSVKNNIYIKEGSTIYRSFLSTSKSYGVAVKGIGLNATGVSEINNSIRKHTGDSNIGISSNNSNNSNSIISSSLSFKQLWKESFYMDSLSCRFKPEGEDSIICKALVASRLMHFANFSSFDMIEIPYKEKYSMYVMLPSQKSTLSKSLSDLYKAGLHKCITWVSDSSRTYHYESIVDEIDTLKSDTIVNLYLPLFKHSATMELNSPSVSSNKKGLYETNLPSVSPNGFKLGNIYQSCQLEITRDGTSATVESTAEIQHLALTTTINHNFIIIGGIVEQPGGGQRRPKVIKETVTIPCHIDRPFAIFIRDNETGAIPFSACIINVTKAGN